MCAINILTLLILFVLAITKLMDVQSTSSRIRSPSFESNPFARRLMTRYGTGVVIWGIFVLALLIIALAGALAFSMGKFFQIVFIIFGSIVSIIQFSVAMNNWTGKENKVTRFVRRFYSRIGSLLYH